VRVLAASQAFQELRTALEISEHALKFRGLQRGTRVATAIGMAHLAHEALTHLIIQAFFQVWNELGHGYSEKIYRRALAMVLREMGLEAIEERHIKVIFHSKVIGTFWVDIVVAGKIVIEIKAAKELEPRDEAQLLNYLKCAGGGVGLLVNFGRTLTYRRLVMGDPEANLPNLVALNASDPSDADTRSDSLSD